MTNSNNETPYNQQELRLARHENVVYILVLARMRVTLAIQEREREWAQRQQESLFSSLSRSRFHFEL